MYIVGFVILGIAVLLMLVIAIRRFPLLANLDLENIPEEKEAKKKKEMIDRLVTADRRKLNQTFSKVGKPLQKIWGKLQLKFRIYVGQIERLLHHEQRNKEIKQMPTEAVEAKLSVLVQDGASNLQQNNLEKAEEMFIAAIKLDPKCGPAYRGLGDTYLAKGSFDEAEETYHFLLQLHPNDDMAMAKVSELREKKGDLEGAITNLQQAVVLNDSLSSRFFHLAELLLKVDQPKVAKEAIVQAVELEPKNPKFLDLLIETGILCSDKDLAERSFKELRLVNPQNQKLESFQARINAL